MMPPTVVPRFVNAPITVAPISPPAIAYSTTVRPSSSFQSEVSEVPRIVIVIAPTGAFAVVTGQVAREGTMGRAVTPYRDGAHGSAARRTLQLAVDVSDDAANSCSQVRKRPDYRGSDQPTRNRVFHDCQTLFFLPKRSIGGAQDSHCYCSYWCVCCCNGTGCSRRHNGARRHTLSRRRPRVSRPAHPATCR